MVIAATKHLLIWSCKHMESTFARAGKVEKEAAAPDGGISNSGESHVVQKPRRVILIVHFCSSLFQFSAFQLCVFVSSPIPSPHAVPYPVPMQSHTLVHHELQLPLWWL